MHDELSLLYHDEHLVAVDKPPGHLVHPAEHPQADDLVTMKILRDQIGKRVHSIHRLDRPTSGVLLFGLNPEVSHSLHKAFETRDVTKHYWAIVNAIPEQKEWQCHEPIQKKDTHPFREASTSFRTLRTLSADDSPLGQNVSLIEATPHTGRYHQIRRHLLHAGMPIIGDYRYAGVEKCNFLGQQLGTGTRMLLHAKRLTFTHPISYEELTVESPTPECFQKCFLDTF